MRYKKYLGIFGIIKKNNLQANVIHRPEACLSFEQREESTEVY